MCDASESRNSLSDQTFEMCELEILARRKSGSEKIEANRLDLISSTPAGKTKTTSNESTWHFVSRLVRGRGRRRRKTITCPTNKQTVLLSLSAVVLVVSSMSMLMPVVRAVPVPKIRDRNSLTSAMMYLMKYGYMDDMGHHHGEQSANLMSPMVMHKKIAEFQKFANIEVTGELDEHTIEMMNMPRCGVKDNVGHKMYDDETENHHSRKKRYALQGSRWRVKDLTYRISKYPSSGQMSSNDVDREVQRALDVWSEYTDLTFTHRRSGRVHIDIRFEKKEHGDGDPFDGSGGTLAHAFFPVFGGDAHFDDDEFWTKGSFRGTNLLQTAAHEFGHSLGLSHSDENEALMAPFYRGFESKPKLNEDDIKAIQKLYGTKSRVTDTTPIINQIPDSSNFEPDDPSNDRNNPLCDNGKIDAIVTVKDNSTYVFRGAEYFKLTEDSIGRGYPRRISGDWSGLPANIDAAFTWKNGKTYIFKGTQYWRFTNRNMDSGYPKPISKGFDGIPNRIDAAFVWSGNGKIYFFKGSKYYRFDPDARPPVKDTYPKPIENWEGIPDNIDDALQYTNGYTYFFKNGLYWRFDDRGFKVDRANPDFPRKAGVWWFGCSERESVKRRPASVSSSSPNPARFSNNILFIFLYAITTTTLSFYGSF